MVKVLRSLPMTSFYLAIPRPYEDEVVEELGRLGIVQLTKERVEIGEEVSELSTYDKFLRVSDRVSTLLTSIEGFLGSKEDYGKVEKNLKMNLEEMEKFSEEYGKIIDEIAKEFDSIQREQEELKNIINNLEFLKTYKIRLDEIGEFKHVFVKVGFIQNVFLTKLEEYLKDLETVFEAKPGRPKESLVIIVGNLEYKSNVEKALTLLNFEELKFPKWINPDPELALQDIKKKMDSNIEKIRDQYKKLIKINEKILERKPYVSFMRDVKSSLFRTKSLSLLRGWIPVEKSSILKEKVEALTGKIMYLKFEEPKHEETVPVKLRDKGILAKFELLTILRGIPSYFEINPTPIFMILFILMYGMMFGDFGEGIVISLLGAFFATRKKAVLGIGRNAINKLGWIMIFSGAVATFFGLLYGEAFLYHSHLLEEVRLSLGLPALGPLSEMEKITQMIVIALIFGVVQLIISLSLGFINRFRKEGAIEAIFNGKGLLGLIYYISGVFLTVNIVQSGMRLDAFLYPQNIPLTAICLISLLLIGGSPFFVSTLKKHEFHLAEKVFEGFGEAIEIFIGFLANSFSYLRVAAFAVAHAALGLSAEMLSEMAGPIVGYLLMNFIGILIEGFVVGIQTIRLLYYEFSTKFYSGGGIVYRPITLPITFEKDIKTS
ncbi:MAG: V-type ATPase 116kDa subunit family protein [Nitrososphaerales archaeon]